MADFGTSFGRRRYFRGHFSLDCSMKKYSKAGLLIVTLVIPALIFTFLRFFATNHYNIPYYYPLKDASGNVSMNGKDTLYYSIASLNAGTVKGGRVPLHPFKGKLTVVQYQSDICNDSCLILLNSLERIYDLRSGIKSLNLLTISDSLSDVVKKSPAYTGRDGWLLALIDPADLKIVLNETFKFQTIIPKAKTNSTESKLILIDSEEHIRGYYNGFDKEEIDRLMAEIKILDFEKGTGSQHE